MTVTFPFSFQSLTRERRRGIMFRCQSAKSVEVTPTFPIQTSSCCHRWFGLSFGCWLPLLGFGGSCRVHFSFFHSIDNRREMRSTTSMLPSFRGEAHGVLCFVGSFSISVFLLRMEESSHPSLLDCRLDVSL